MDDLRRLLHVLGRGLPHWLVREAAGVLATAVRSMGSVCALSSRFLSLPCFSECTTCSISREQEQMMLSLFMAVMPEGET